MAIVISLNSFYELSDEAFVHSTALNLGTPLPHALYLKAQVGKYADIVVWGDSLLNDPAHAGAGRKITHDKFALELSKLQMNVGWLQYSDYGK